MADNIGLQRRKVRKIVIEEDKCGDWRIRVYFDKGRCKASQLAYDNFSGACKAASGIDAEQNWVPPLSPLSTK